MNTKRYGHVLMNLDKIIYSIDGPKKWWGFKHHRNKLSPTHTSSTYLTGIVEIDNCKVKFVDGKNRTY